MLRVSLHRFIDIFAPRPQTTIVQTNEETIIFAGEDAVIAQASLPTGDYLLLARLNAHADSPADPNGTYGRGQIQLKVTSPDGRDTLFQNDNNNIILPYSNPAPALTFSYILGATVLKGGLAQVQVISVFESILVIDNLTLVCMPLDNLRLVKHYPYLHLLQGN